MPMDVARAFEITIELARQNVADQLNHPEYHKEQQEAIDIIEDIAVNQFGDD